MLVSYEHARQTVHSALAAVLSASASTAGVDAATLLLRAEQTFLETLGATAPHQAPTSLVRELASSQELRDLLDRALAATVRGTALAPATVIGELGRVDGGEEVAVRPHSKRGDGCGVLEAAALLENMCVFLRESTSA